MSENKPHILWIHGFAGRSNNDTVLEMIKKYPQYSIYSIEVDHHALQSMQKIDDYIRQHHVDLVAGTSLGGYFAMCADTDSPKFVVNPVMDPVHDLRQFLGKNTYKPGREDGQTEFDFTEEMLNEFSTLHIRNLERTLCHYTAHDALLGEDIKKKYQEAFYHLEQIDEKILPGHFMTFSYVKRAMKQPLFAILDAKVFDYTTHQCGTDSKGNLI